MAGEWCHFSANLSTGKRRFSTLKIRLQTNVEFKDMYHRQILDYISTEQAEWFQHAVEKQRKNSIIYRLIFNASSNDAVSTSLNDAIEIEPKLELPHYYDFGHIPRPWFAMAVRVIYNQFFMKMRET